MSKILQRRTSMARVARTKRGLPLHTRSTMLHYALGYKKIENRTRALECCIFETKANKTATE